MKHFFLTLLCVGTCFAAMAVTPLIKGKTDVVLNRLEKVDLKKELVSQRRQFRSIVPVEEKAMTLQNFFTEFGVTPDDNLLLKKAPRRVSHEDLASTKLAFMDCYGYNPDNGDIELSNNSWDGGWDVDMEQVDDGMYYAYLYYNQIPVTIYVDIENKYAEMEMGCLGGWEWSDTTFTGSGTRRTYIVSDTIEYLYIIDENYMMGNGDDFCNVGGTIYSDGSLYFPDGYTFYIVDYVTTTKYNYNWVQQSQTEEANEYPLTPFYHNTYLLTPSATHDYDIRYGENDLDHYQNNVYMFQYDDSTAVVWNLWQFGGKGSFMYLHEDWSMTFPIGQIVGTEDVAELEEYYPDYDWSEGYNFNLYNYDLEIDDYSIEDITGTATPESLAWDASVIMRYCTLDGNYYAIQYYPLINNVLNFTNGDYFKIGYAERPTISSSVYDDIVEVVAETSSENCTAYLFDSDGNLIENPTYIERTNENQELTFYAVGVEYGRNQSEVTTATVLIPALALLGDIDNNGTVSLNDVITLIDLMLNNNNLSDACDVNQDGVFTIADVTALISMIVNAK